VPCPARPSSPARNAGGHRFRSPVSHPIAEIPRTPSWDILIGRGGAGEIPEGARGVETRGCRSRQGIPMRTCSPALTTPPRARNPCCGRRSECGRSGGDLSYEPHVVRKRPKSPEVAMSRRSYERWVSEEAVDQPWAVDVLLPTCDRRLSWPPPLPVSPANTIGRSVWSSATSRRVHRAGSTPQPLPWSGSSRRKAGLLRRSGTCPGVAWPNTGSSS
jgi:hypothetical protein